MNLFKFFLVAILMTGAFAMASAPASAEVRAGGATVETTPEWPVFLGGYYVVNTRSSGVHDPLFTRAVYINDGENSVMLISLDCVIMSGIFSRETKQMIEEKLGIPSANVTITATHLHTGPEGYYEEYGKYPKEYDPNLKIFMQEKVVEAAEKAVENSRPATISIQVLDLTGFMRNRHDPNGAVDPTGILLIARDESGNPFTGFLNMPSHATSAPVDQLKISAGWPGYFTAAMEEKLGEGSTFAFLQGATGNISPRGAKGDTAWDRIQDYGQKLANKIWKSVEGGPAGVSELTVAGVDRLYEGVPVRRGKSVREYAAKIPEEIEKIQASDMPDNEKERRIGWMKERMGTENFMQPMIKSMSRVEKGRTTTMIQAMKIGDALVVTFPGEPIAEVSVEMRKRFGDTPLIVLGYTNDHLGYLTTTEVYDQGGYEAGMGLLYPEATYKFMDDVQALAESLK